MDLNDTPKHWSDCSVYKDPIVLGTECDCGGYKPKDLTDDEIDAVINAEDSKHIMRDATELELARAVIAADREKNNPLTKSNKGE